MFPALLEKKFGKTFSKKAQKLFYKMSVVEDAMTAVKVGVRKTGLRPCMMPPNAHLGRPVRSSAGSRSRRTHSQRRHRRRGMRAGDLRLFRYRFLCFDQRRYLIASCRPQKAEAVVKALAKKSIKSSVVGELVEAKNGMILVENGKEKKLKHPIVDPSGVLSMTRSGKRQSSA